MLSFSIRTVVLFMLSCTSAFTPIADNQGIPSIGMKSGATVTIRKFEINESNLRLSGDHYDRDISRNLAVSMATKLKFSDDEKDMINSTLKLNSRVESLFPSAEILTIEMSDHIPLGCTVEESLHEDDDFIFISKLAKGGHAEATGLEVGDVIVGVTGMFGELVCTIDVDVERIKQLVSAVVEEEPLIIQVVRGTSILERHESTIVELCSVVGASDKEVQDCVVDFLVGGYEYDNDDIESKEDTDESVCENDQDAECLIDGMMNLWADELPSPSTTTEITEQEVKKTSKPKPWSSRSSPSGTWVRDPKTGKMRNIDA